MVVESHNRSISLPSRSHPAVFKIEEELNKLRSLLEPSKLTSSSICIALSRLEDLYTSVNDLLNLSSAQEILTQNRNRKCFDEFLDGSVKLLDIGGATRDILLEFKEEIQSLQFSFRRRKGDLNFEKSITNYTSFRKKMEKDSKKFISTLKQMENRLQIPKFDDFYLFQLLMEVIIINSFVFQTLISFLATSKPKQSKWPMVSKLMHKGRVACEEKQDIGNELVSVDIALKEKTNFDKKALEALEMSIEGIEGCLERLFRHLIRTRASILNIISL